MTESDQLQGMVTKGAREKLVSGPNYRIVARNCVGVIPDSRWKKREKSTGEEKFSSSAIR